MDIKFCSGVVFYAHTFFLRKQQTTVYYIQYVTLIEQLTTPIQFHTSR